MTVITGGHTAPRDGAYKTADNKQVLIDGRHHLHIPLKAGDKFPGGSETEYEVYELRPGETVPKDGVWVHMPSGKEYPLQEGAKFPAATGGDYVWAREA